MSAGSRPLSRWRDELPKVCGQCRQPMQRHGEGWRHRDGTPRCPQGAALAVQAITRALASGMWRPEGPRREALPEPDGEQ